MHIEHSCRTAATFLPLEMRDPGIIRPRQWRAWINCAAPYDRHPTPRRGFLAYEHSDILGFIAVMHDSLYAGYGADCAGLYVLPKYRREGIGTRLLVEASRWLMEEGITRMTADCYAKDPSRRFFERLGAFVIASNADEENTAAVITYGFANLKEIAGHEE